LTLAGSWSLAEVSWPGQRGSWNEGKKKKREGKKKEPECGGQIGAASPQPAEGHLSPDHLYGQSGEGGGKGERKKKKKGNYSTGFGGGGVFPFVVERSAGLGCCWEPCKGGGGGGGKGKGGKGKGKKKKRVLCRLWAIPFLRPRGAWGREGGGGKGGGGGEKEAGASFVLALGRFVPWSQARAEGVGGEKGEGRGKKGCRSVRLGLVGQLLRGRRRGRQKGKKKGRGREEKSSTAQRGHCAQKNRVRARGGKSGGGEGRRTLEPPGGGAPDAVSPAGGLGGPGGEGGGTGKGGKEGVAEYRLGIRAAEGCGWETVERKEKGGRKEGCGDLRYPARKGAPTRLLWWPPPRGMKEKEKRERGKIYPLLLLFLLSTFSWRLALGAG